MALEDHLFVELAHAHRLAFAVRKKNAIQSAIGNGARIEDRQPCRAVACRHNVAHAIPREPRPQFRKLIGRVAPAEQIEHALKRGASEASKGRRMPHEFE